jgi:hypothetical protein
MILARGDRRKNHEALFLPVLVGCGRYSLGHILVAGSMGKMGDHYRGRHLGYHEPFLPNMLLPKHEKSRSGSRQNLASP